MLSAAEQERARIGARPLPPKVDHMITVYAKDGTPVEVFPIDGRELVESGEYSATAPAPVTLVGKKGGK